MGWDKGRYYTRSRKINGKVIREYVGGGEIGRLAAELDTAERRQKQLEDEIEVHERADVENLDRDALDLFDQIEHIAQAALFLVGCHNHRGQWRRKRACSKRTTIKGRD